MTASERQSIEDQTRAMVQWALSERAGVSGSVFEVFSGKGRHQREKLGRRARRPRYIAGDAGKVILANDQGGLSPTRVHAVESARQRSSSVPMASGRSGSDIIRAINALPHVQQQWVHYCYNPSPSKKRAAARVIGPSFWAEFKSRSDLKGVHLSTLVKLQRLLIIILDHSRSYPSFCRWTSRRPLEIEGDIGRSSWSDTYCDHWKSMRAMLEQIDAEAMRNIYSKLILRKA